METIRLQEAIAVMEATGHTGAPIPFSIDFITCDLGRKRGGERVYIPSAVISSSRTAAAEDIDIAGRSAQPRNAAHRANSTRNIRPTASGDLIKVHNLLIEKINGQRVVL